MTFNQLIQNATWQSISSKFLEIYPDAEEDLAGYKSVFEKLTIMTPEECDISIVITHEKDKLQEYFDVSGLHNNPKNEEESYSQGIELMPWRQWLGMQIGENILSEYSEKEIVVHCLYEMTFVGFSEDKIQKVMARSLKDSKEREPITEEEAEKTRIAVEKFLNTSEASDE